MGTHETNDDGAMGPEPFDEMTGPMGDCPAFDAMMGHAKQAGMRLSPYATSKASSVIADEQRMADVFAECAKAVAALRGGIEMLDEVAKGMKDQPRFRTSLLMEAAASSLETAIARANGGAA